jgi:hypothetical protein
MVTQSVCSQLGDRTGSATLLGGGDGLEVGHQADVDGLVDERLERLGQVVRVGNRGAASSPT